MYVALWFYFFFPMPSWFCFCIVVVVVVLEANGNRAFVIFLEMPISNEAAWGIWFTLPHSHVCGYMILFDSAWQDSSFKSYWWVKVKCIWQIMVNDWFNRVWFLLRGKLVADKNGLRFCLASRNKQNFKEKHEILKTFQRNILILLVNFLFSLNFKLLKSHF